jgi:hypothetical protein
MCGVRCTVITHLCGVPLDCRVAWLLVATDKCNVAARRHRRRQSGSGPVVGADIDSGDDGIVGSNGGRRRATVLRSTVDVSSGGW